MKRIAPATPCRHPFVLVPIGDDVIRCRIPTPSALRRANALASEFGDLSLEVARISDATERGSTAWREAHAAWLRADEEAEAAGGWTMLQLVDDPAWQIDAQELRAAGAAETDPATLRYPGLVYGRAFVAELQELTPLQVFAAAVFAATAGGGASQAVMDKIQEQATFTPDQTAPPTE